MSNRLQGKVVAITGGSQGHRSGNRATLCLKKARTFRSATAPTKAGADAGCRLESKDWPQSGRLSIRCGNRFGWPEIHR